MAKYLSFIPHPVVGTDLQSPSAHYYEILIILKIIERKCNVRNVADPRLFTTSAYGTTRVIASGTISHIVPLHQPYVTDKPQQETNT